MNNTRNRESPIKKLIVSLIMLVSVLLLLPSLWQEILINATALDIIYNLRSSSTPFMILLITQNKSIRMNESVQNINPKYRINRINGIRLALEGDLEKSEKVLEEVHKQDSIDFIGDLWLGAVQSAEGKDKLANQIWEDQSAGRMLVWVGDFYLANDDVNAAITWYEKAIRVLSKNANIQSDRNILGQSYGKQGDLYSKQGNPNLAADYYEKALQYLPEREDYRYSLSTQYLLMNKFEEGVDQLKLIIKANPSSPVPYAVLGEVYRSAGMPNEAEQAFLKSLGIEKEINPNDRYWHERSILGLSTIYTIDNKWDESLMYSRRAVLSLYEYPEFYEQVSQNITALITANPNSLEWYINVGDAYYKAGRIDDAKYYYELALSRWPNNPIILDRITRFE